MIHDHRWGNLSALARGFIVPVGKPSLPPNLSFTTPIRSPPERPRSQKGITHHCPGSPILGVSRSSHLLPTRPLRPLCHARRGSFTLAIPVSSHSHLEPSPGTIQSVHPPHREPSTPPFLGTQHPFREPLPPIMRVLRHHRRGAFPHPAQGVTVPVAGLLAHPSGRLTAPIKDLRHPSRGVIHHHRWRNLSSPTGWFIVLIGGSFRRQSGWFILPVGEPSPPLDPSFPNRHPSPVSFPPIAFGAPGTRLEFSPVGRPGHPEIGLPFPPRDYPWRPDLGWWRESRLILPERRSGCQLHPRGNLATPTGAIKEPQLDHTSLPRKPPTFLWTERNTSLLGSQSLLPFTPVEELFQAQPRPAITPAGDLRQAPSVMFTTPNGDLWYIPC